MITDAGDVPVAGGGRVRARAVFRLSGGLVRSNELGALEAAGLRRVVDLRGEDEDRSVIQDWARSNHVDYVSQPIPAAGKIDFADAARDGLTPDQAADRMTSLYREIVDDHGSEIAGTIAAMADEQPAGYGCAAGKDRTGIVTAFLQTLLGVAEDEIVRRYVQGAPGLDSLGPLARGYLELDDGDPLPAGIEKLLEPLPDSIRAALDEAERADGSVPAYLERNGLRPETAAGLRERLLVAG